MCANVFHIVILVKYIVVVWCTYNAGMLFRPDCSFHVQYVRCHAFNCTNYASTAFSPLQLSVKVCHVLCTCMFLAINTNTLHGWKFVHPLCLERSLYVMDVAKGYHHPTFSNLLLVKLRNYLFHLPANFLLLLIL